MPPLPWSKLPPSNSREPRYKVNVTFTYLTYVNYQLSAKCCRITQNFTYLIFTHPIQPETTTTTNNKQSKIIYFSSSICVFKLQLATINLCLVFFFQNRFQDVCLFFFWYEIVKLKFVPNKKIKFLQPRNKFWGDIIYWLKNCHFFPFVIAAYLCGQGQYRYFL